VGLTNSQLKDLAVKNIDDNAENMMSAKDVGKMAAYLVNHYPDLLKIAGQTSFEMDGQSYTNINKMLTESKYQTNGVTIDGLKTGTSDAAGACLVSTATFKNRHIVTIVLHANGDSTDARFTATQKLYQLIVNS
ncbi:D-alanyl-D-alanine carboxypeptidase, partial [Limosilactobacillus mucosae]|nr:D-alanyl-D-alanine carboxypeptidase [Limosilactobacillus mucosae]